MTYAALGLCVLVSLCGGFVIWLRKQDRYVDYPEFRRKYLKLKEPKKDRVFASNP